MARETIAFSSGLMKALYPELCEDILSAGYFSGEEKGWDAAPIESLPEEPSSLEEKIRGMASLPMRTIAPRSDKPVVVILAGGKGSRMGEGIQQKVLSPIGGHPALRLAMETYRSFGLKDFILIVGVGYKDVLRCIGAEDGVTYLYQDAPLGTGHACRLASRYLKFMDYEGDVVVTMGDKYVTAHGLQRLLENHQARRPDLTLTTASKSAWPDSGRVALGESGGVCAIVEKPDIVLKRLIYDFVHWPSDPVPAKAFWERALSYWPRPQKLRKILGAFGDVLETEEWISKEKGRRLLRDCDPYFSISETMKLLGSEIEERCEEVNLSLYIFQSRALYESTEKLEPNNAQGELYLTDAAHYLVSQNHDSGYRVVTSRMPDDYDVMGFNTVEELARIEGRARRDSTASQAENE
ncbi:MAG: NTP transferase domain-containing protein [Candidatus Omnitrophota bacterium]